MDLKIKNQKVRRTLREVMKAALRGALTYIRLKVGK